MKNLNHVTFIVFPAGCLSVVADGQKRRGVLLRGTHRQPKPLRLRTTKGEAVQPLPGLVVPGAGRPWRLPTGHIRAGPGTLGPSQELAARATGATLVSGTSLGMGTSRAGLWELETSLAGVLLGQWLVATECKWDCSV